MKMCRHHVPTSACPICLPVGTRVVYQGMLGSIAKSKYPAAQEILVDGWDETLLLLDYQMADVVQLSGDLKMSVESVLAIQEDNLVAGLPQHQNCEIDDQYCSCPLVIELQDDVDTSKHLVTYASLATFLLAVSRSSDPGPYVPIRVIGLRPPTEADLEEIMARRRGRHLAEDRAERAARARTVAATSDNLGTKSAEDRHCIK